MPESEDTWVDRCKVVVREYINNAYTLLPNPEVVPSYELEVVWAISSETSNRVLIRTDIGDFVRYLVTHTLVEDTDNIVIEAIVDGPMEAKTTV